jgi:alkyl hydroperoxide reductase subunit AhpF
MAEDDPSTIWIVRTKSGGQAYWFHTKRAAVAAFDALVVAGAGATASIFPARKG